MATLYETLKIKYGLSETYPTISFEQEKKEIAKYQSPKTPEYVKKQIIDLFWNINKARIVQQAIKLHSYLLKIYSGDLNLEIDELIQKGFMAIPHCLNIYHKCTKKNNETQEQFKQRKAKINETRFGTLLQWWIRPFIMQRINQENFLIYVPHSKNTEKKSISVGSIDTQKFDNNPKTNAEFIADDNDTPDQIMQKQMFWEFIKENLTPEEYEFLVDWTFMDSKFDYKKDFYNHYKLNSSQAKKKLDAIKKKLQPILQDWKDSF